MSQRASPTLIGGFVLGAAALVVVGLLVFGSGKLFTEKVTWVAYFDESVGGLTVGAPVTFRGVKVGQVSSVRVRLDSRDLSIRIPVFLEIWPDRVTATGDGEGISGIGPELIERGLRAQLQLQSFVTGQLAIQLDFHEGTTPRFEGTDLGYPEMPTIPSSMRELAETIQSLSLEELVRDAQETLQGINRVVNSPELSGALEGLNETVGELQSLIRNVDERVGPISASLERALDQTRQTLAEAEETLAGAREALAIGAEDSPVRYELLEVLRELAAAARSVRVLADYLERNPDSLLRGRAPAGGS